MGSPLGPALAKAFLCRHEVSWLDNCPLSYAPVFYARYVDDVFVLLRSADHVQQLVSYLSSQHTNINFTFEVEIVILTYTKKTHLKNTTFLLLKYFPFKLASSFMGLLLFER